MFNLLNWLKSGAIFYLGKNKYLLSCGLSSKSCEPKSFPCYYSPDFYLSANEPWHSYKFNQVVDKQAVLSILNSSFISSDKKELSMAFEQPPSQEFYKIFEQIQILIQQGHIKKLVPVVFENVNYKVDQSQLQQMLLNLIHTSQEQNIYGMWDNGSGLLGLTPEILFELKENCIETMALAGTGLSKNVSTSLLQDEKETHEHNLVVESLKLSLSKYGDLTVGETYEWNLNPLKHLRTDIKIQSKNFDCRLKNINTLINELHPTPALGVYPKNFDWHKIKDFESCDRKKYGAPFGLMLKDQFKSVVAIRNIQWQQDEVLLGSGCGIVKKSNAQTEWQELKNKRNSVKKYLGLTL